MKYAIRQPLMTIATNAGLDASVIVNKVGFYSYFCRVRRVTDALKRLRDTFKT